MNPMQPSGFETERPEFVGLSLKEVENRLQKLNLEPYIVWKDGKWNDEIRTSILRPEEVNLVVEKNLVKRAYQIL